MRQYTPGPWIADPRGTISSVYQNRPIAETLLHQVQRSECDSCANAQLIAAAPELLSALKNILARSGFNQGEWAEARAAIAKAEGT